MRAIVLSRTGGPEQLELRDVPDPSAGPGEVVVRVEASGVCGRDLIDRAGGFPMLKLPMILGHEFAGRVESVGSGVTSLKVGERVVNLHRAPCGECEQCARGESVDCVQSWQSFGHTIDGAYAERVLAPERALVKVPDGIPSHAAASVMCTAGVALRALRHEAELQLGEQVLITGASGGVGVAALALCRRMGATSIALTSSAAKVEALKQLGADHVVVNRDGRFSDEVQRLSGGGVDVALELTGAATFSGALRSLKPRGRLVVLGNIDVQRVPLNPGALILFSKRVIGSHGASADDVRDCFALMARSELELPLDSRLPLDGAADAHRKLAERRAVGRIVLEP